MMLLRAVTFTFVATVAAACVDPVPPPITEDMTLGGVVVDAATLDRGREGYILYCYACHGFDGDGNGPASYALRPPPRDFRTYTFKFAGVASGLPHDEDLIRIVKRGLKGTAMLPWDIPDATLHDIVQYIKTFSPEGEGFRDPDAEMGEQIVPGTDPWAGKEEEAIERGEKVYHGLATCWSCHPAYVSRHAIAMSIWELKKQKTQEFRSNLYRPELKDSQYSVTVKDKTTKIKLLPPDFMVNEIRAGSTPPDLFRTLAAGIGGTAMPAWKGALPDEDIWAMAHYVAHLTGWKGTPKVGELKARLEADNTPITFPDAAEPAEGAAPTGEGSSANPPTPATDEKPGQAPPPPPVNK